MGSELKKCFNYLKNFSLDSKSKLNKIKKWVKYLFMLEEQARIKINRTSKMC